MPRSSGLIPKASFDMAAVVDSVSPWCLSLMCLLRLEMVLNAGFSSHLQHLGFLVLKTGIGPYEGSDSVTYQGYIGEYEKLGPPGFTGSQEKSSK